jgi:excisionase family DNA binding protein
MDAAEQPNRGEIVAAVVQRRTLTVEEAGRMLGLGRGAAYAAVKRGQIPSLSLGRRIVVPVAALELMLAGAGTQTDSGQ